MIAARVPGRKPARTAVMVAIGTALLVNALLLGLLELINRERPLPPAPEPILHRLTPPPTLPTVAAAQAAATSSAASRPVPVSIPLPALELPLLATGIPLALPSLPRIDAAQPVALPTVVAGSIAGVPSPLSPDLSAVWRVDEPPVLVNGFDLERFYPRQARLRGVEGATILRLEIATDGSVAASTVVSSEPPGIFDAAAKSLARTLHFTPARNRGTPVACAINQTIAWRLPR